VDLLLELAHGLDAVHHGPCEPDPEGLLSPRDLPIATVLFAFSQLLLALMVFLPALVLVSGVRIHSTPVLFVPVLLLPSGQRSAW